jgi:hypothetical protein
VSPLIPLLVGRSGGELRAQPFAFQVEDACVGIWTSTLSGDNRIQRFPSDENRDNLGFPLLIAITPKAGPARLTAHA